VKKNPGKPKKKAKKKTEYGGCERRGSLQEKSYSRKIGRAYAEFDKKEKKNMSKEEQMEKTDTKVQIIAGSDRKYRRRNRKKRANYGLFSPGGEYLRVEKGRGKEGKEGPQ